MTTTHEDHIKGNYFNPHCDECAKFIGFAVMHGRIKAEINRKVIGEEIEGKNQ